MRPTTTAEMLSPLPATAALVTCEREGAWAGACRRLLPSLPLIETRTLDDAWSGLQRHPHGVLLVELTPERAPQIVSLLVRVQLELPGVLTVACGARVQGAWERLLREAGVALVVSAPWRLHQAASLLRRHLAQAPHPPHSLREQIWQSLPWHENRTLPPAAPASGASETRS